MKPSLEIIRVCINATGARVPHASGLAHQVTSPSREGEREGWGERERAKKKGKEGARERARPGASGYEPFEPDHAHQLLTYPWARIQGL